VNVQPAAARAELVQAAARITRVSLADLLNSSSGNPREQRALADLMRAHGTISARVLETRADGVSVLELVNARVALRLAAPHAPGEILQLALDDSAPGAAPATVPMAAVKLSAPALLITDIQHNDIQKIVLNQKVIQEAVTTPASAPMTEATASPKVLAHALQHAVRHSGLFYESHLRGWVDGQVPLETLLEEPQARVAHTAGAHGTHETHEARAAVHPQLEPLVRQQLETFERQSIAWHGYLWPGQQAGIVISGEPHAALQEGEAPRAWRVRLDLSTPALGPVAADIALAGRQLEVRLAGTGATAQTMREARATLARALGAHDLDVQPIRVAGGE
jgi:Flagellar hook-length control protein FliK